MVEEEEEGDEAAEQEEADDMEAEEAEPAEEDLRAANKALTKQVQPFRALRNPANWT